MSFLLPPFVADFAETELPLHHSENMLDVGADFRFVTILIIDSQLRSTPPPHSQSPSCSCATLRTL